MKAEFSTTQWSRVLTARDGSDSHARRALETLCQTYWYPLYVFVRRQGHDHDAARDLTQAYFAELLEKDFLKDVEPGLGRFRSFLLASLKPYLTGGAGLAHYREVAAELGLTEGAVRAAVLRLRKRFGKALRAEIAETVADPAEIDDEIRRLLSAIRPWQGK